VSGTAVGRQGPSRYELVVLVLFVVAVHDMLFSAAGKRGRELMWRRATQEGIRPNGGVASMGGDGGHLAGEGRSGGGGVRFQP
jgi:hypothetical protein